MASITDKTLPEKDDDELAVLGERNHPLSAEGILLNKEWQRRLLKEQQELSKAVMLEQHELNRQLMLEQHELNKKILDKQSKLTKLSIAIGFGGIIVGAVIGSALTVLGPSILSKVLSPVQKVSSEQPTLKSIEPTESLSVKQDVQATPVPLATKEKDDSVSSKSPPK